MPSAEVYADKLISITSDTIILKNYYFLVFGRKEVKFSDIKNIEAVPTSLFTGRYRIQGTGDMRTWFPLDIRRPGRDNIFIINLKNKWTRIGFTVENSGAVKDILKEKGLLN
ncbi:MAG: hypothetical protein ACM3S2_18695 [Ignavibacteriales bacterium]